MPRVQEQEQSIRSTPKLPIKSTFCLASRGFVWLLTTLLLQHIQCDSNVGGYKMISSQRLFSDSSNDIISLELYFSGPDGQLFCGGREQNTFFQAKTVFAGSGASMTAAMTVTSEFQLVTLATDRIASLIRAIPYTVSVLVAVNNIGGAGQISQPHQPNSLHHFKRSECQRCAMMKYDTSTNYGIGLLADLLYPKDSGSISSLTLTDVFPGFITGPNLKLWKISDLSTIKTSSYTNANQVSQVALASGSKLYGFDSKAKRVIRFDANSLDALEIISLLSDLFITNMRSAFGGSVVLACTISSCYCVQVDDGAVWAQKSNRLSMDQGEIYTNFGLGILATIGLENSPTTPGSKFAVFGSYVISPTFQNLFQTSSIIVDSNLPSGTNIGVVLSPNDQSVFTFVGQQVSVFRILPTPANCNVSANINGDQESQVCLLCAPNYSLISAPNSNPTCLNIVCSSECATCFGPSNDDCLSCVAPKILSSTNCRYPCPSGCASCLGLAIDDCQVCKPGLFLYKGDCYSCPQNCFECSSNTTCLKCNTSFTTLDPGSKKCVPCWEPADFTANKEVCQTGMNARFVPWTAKVSGVPELGKDSVKQVTLDFVLANDLMGQLMLSTQLLDQGIQLNSSRPLALRYHRTNQILLVANNSMIPEDSLKINLLNKLEFNYIATILDPHSQEQVEYRLAQKQLGLESR